MLRNNLEVAKKRFYSLENKFLKNDSLLKEFNSISLEQFNEGVIELCTEKHSNNSYYMPHRPVIRDDKTLTKMRIVYDASSKYGDSLSLNECLNHVPNLNSHVLDIILKFRLHKIAFSSDTEKAFPQTSMAEEDHNYLRIYYEDYYCYIL